MRDSSGMVNAFVPGRGGLSASEQALVDRRQRLLGPAYRLFYERPVTVVRGEGVWLYDQDGQAYLDVYNNVASVGHCHPHVVEAMSRQAATLSTNTRYLNSLVTDCAERLLGHFPGELGHVMFTCTGSEANDLAVRIARSATGGTGFIVTENAYHGVTDAVAALSPALGPGVGRDRAVRAVPAPDSYRHVNAGDAFRSGVEAALDDFRREGIRPAALIVDTIFSSDGVFPDPPGFLVGAVEAVRAAGGLFIADEVQPGFGRTGEAMWGFQRHGLIPDMVSLGKPMGNGYPVAALVLRPEVVSEFGAKARYFNTFGGNTVAMATAMAVLDVIERENLRENALAVGASLRDRLVALAERHRAIGDVRGAGLYLGVEIVADRITRAPDAALTSRIVNGLRDERVLISATGPRANVLKIRPPLVFSREHVDVFTERMDRVLRRLMAEGAAAG
jgi:4-aminobutyrate aminotransferase-like enzyme